MADKKTPTLIEGEDFIMDELGRMIFTRAYHLKRGHCCQSGCLHCPYGFASKVDPNYPSELQDPWGLGAEEELYDLDD